MNDAILNSINYKINISTKRHYFWNSSGSGYIYGIFICIIIYIYISAIIIILI